MANACACLSRAWSSLSRVCASSRCSSSHSTSCIVLLYWILLFGCFFFHLYFQCSKVLIFQKNKIKILQIFIFSINKKRFVSIFFSCSIICQMSEWRGRGGLLLLNGGAPGRAVRDGAALRRREPRAEEGRRGGPSQPAVGRQEGQRWIVWCWLMNYL